MTRVIWISKLTDVHSWTSKIVNTQRILCKYIISAAGASSVSATQTTVNKSTSEFSNCSAPLPVEFISFVITKNSESSALISWSTAIEINNHHFEIQKSEDGINFQTIAIVAGYLNSSSIVNYSFIDTNPYSEISYYRIKQVDIDEKSSYSAIVSINFSVNDITILPKNNGFILHFPANQKEYLTWQVYSITGVMITKGNADLTTNNTSLEVKLDLPEAIYILCVYSDQNFIKDKFFLYE